MKYADINALLCELGQDVIIKDPVTGQERADTVIRTADLCGDKVPSPWISVSERLPKLGTPVLVWINSSYMAIWSLERPHFEVADLVWEDEDGFWEPDISIVTHWMSLPDLPEVEE